MPRKNSPRGRNDKKSFISTTTDDVRLKLIQSRKHSRIKDRFTKIATGNAYNVLVKALPPPQSR